jgi:hypothetical protein
MPYPNVVVVVNDSSTAAEGITGVTYWDSAINPTMPTPSLSAGVPLSLKIDDLGSHLSTWQYGPLSTLGISYKGGTTYSFWIYVQDNSGLSCTIKGTFQVYPGIVGDWYINGVLITSSNQVVKSNYRTVDFKFVKLTGIADSAYVVTVTGNNTPTLTLQDPSSNATWTGSEAFSDGIYFLTLKAYDGYSMITMNLVSSFNVTGPLTPFETFVIQGVIAGFGVGFILYGVVPRRRH